VILRIKVLSFIFLKKVAIR